MSSTRHAPQGAPFSYEKYMSSSEYTELRGIPGTAVAAKAQLYSDPRKRSLLFLLQSLSVEEGGLQRLGRAISETFPSLSKESLVTFLIDLCINPKVIVRFSGENQSASGFDRVIDAICEFQDRYESKLKSEFVLTTIGKEIFETLDHALEIRKMVGKNLLPRVDSLVVVSFRLAIKLPQAAAPFMLQSACMKRIVLDYNSSEREFEAALQLGLLHRIARSIMNFFGLAVFTGP